MKKLIIYMLPLMFVFFGCNKTVEPDLCAGKSPTTADFDVYESYLTEADRKDPLCVGCIYWVNYPTDTLINNVATFIAKQDSSFGISYEWTIGAIRSNKRQISVNFSDRETSIQSIPITLKVTNSNPLKCFATDAGLEIFTKSILFIAPNTKDSKTVGYYQYYPYSLVNGTFVGTSWDWNAKEFINGDYFAPLVLNGTVHRSDTLIIELGTAKVSRCGNARTIASYYYTNFARQGVRTNFATEYPCNKWNPLNGFIGYRQYENNDRQRFIENITIAKDYNTVEFKGNGKLIFKGKRI